MASVFDIDKKELLALWLADKVTKLISEDGQVARNALSLAVENLEQNDEVKKHINFLKKQKEAIVAESRSAYGLHTYVSLFSSAGVGCYGF
ncbi:MAG: hypothetical protein L6U16_10955 [Porphyromonadaceae bacterium]|nr:MAG: hypothetical protein L6U16_10955 [Porphyromonadaceae bacterium]